jgi:hypothetical protein
LNERWLHLSTSAGKEGGDGCPATVIGSKAIGQLGPHLTTRDGPFGQKIADSSSNMAALRQCSTPMNLTSFLGLTKCLDHSPSLLFDLPPHKELMTKQFSIQQISKSMPQDDALFLLAGEEIASYCL